MSKSRENQYLNDLIDAAPVGIIEFAPPDGRINRWNKQCEKMFGWTEEEVLGKYNPILPEGFDEEYAAQRKRLFGGDGFEGYEAVRLRKDGSCVNVLIYNSFVKDSAGNILGVVAMYVDITEKKKSENKLIWNEILLRTMTESSKQGYLVVDNRNDKILFLNRRFREIWKFIGLEEYSNINFGNIVNNISKNVKNVAQFKDVLKKFNDFKNDLTYEDEVESIDGRIIKYFSTPLHDKNDNYLGRYFIFEDVSHEKQFEILQNSETKYRKMMEDSSEAILLCDITGNIIFANQRAANLLDFSQKNLKNTSIENIFGKVLISNFKELTPGKLITVQSEFINGKNMKTALECTLRLYSGDKVQVTLRDFTQSGKSSDQIHSFIFASDEMKRINYEISRLANLDVDILLVGETGVGKDMIASEIYKRGTRKEQPFIHVSFGTLSETLIESELFGHEKGAFSGADKQKIGKFEAANKGILYIPEISSLPESLQLKLLYFMQYKSISRVGQDARKGDIKLDVRLIMATNENLEDLLKKGKIRKDFYYRITGTTLYIPPLRERKDDIEVLANYFLDLYSKSLYGKRFQLSSELIDMLVDYTWPGNVRELANSIKNALSFTGESLLKPEHFKKILKLENNSLNIDNELNLGDGDMITYSKAEQNFQKKYFEKLLKQTNGSITKTAKFAGMTPQGLRKAIKKLKIKL